MVRPTQQISTKRKRQSNDLIWARDGDGENAQEHPAYLLENCNEDDGVLTCNNNDKVWVEWSSNGTIACIPKSRLSTSGLSPRRSRHKSTVRKQPEHDKEPMSNDTSDYDKLPSVRNSKATKEIHQVKREDLKVKEEGNGDETDNDGDEEEDTVPTPVVSLHPKEEEYEEEDTDDDVALDQVQSTHVNNKVKEELEESTDEEGIAPDLVQSTHIKTEEAGEDTDDGGITSDVKEGEVTLSQIRLNQRRTKLKQKKPGRLQNGIIPKSVQSTREKEEDEDDYDDEEGGDADADNTDGDIKTLQYVVPDQILVEGCMFTKSRVECCPLSNMNGTYYPVARLSKANAPVYSKRGEWKGKAVDLVIRRNKNDNGWVIYHWKGNVNHSGTYAKKRLYTSKDKVDPDRKYHRRYQRYTNVPPPTGWKAKWYHIDGKKLHDEPTLKYGYNTSEIWEKSPMVSAKIMQEWGYDSDMYDKSEAESCVDEDDPWNYEDESDDNTYSIANLESNIEEFIKSAHVYLWCESYGELLLLPYNYYLFWRMLNQCQTWGEIRRLCYGKNKRFYNRLLERYEIRCSMTKEKYNVDKLTDDKPVCMDDFNLCEHSQKDVFFCVGLFPPLIEHVMWQAAVENETQNWMLGWAEIKATVSSSGEQWLKFDLKDKDAIFKELEDLGYTLRYSTKLSWFRTRFQYEGRW